MSGIIIKRENLEPDGHPQREDNVKMAMWCRGRDWNDVAASQGMPGLAGHHQELRKILPRV